MMQQQLTRAEPARIQIRKIPTRRSMKGSLSPLMGNQNVLHVKPHASREKQTQSQTGLGILAHSSLTIRENLLKLPFES